MEDRFETEVFERFAKITCRFCGRVEYYTLEKVRTLGKAFKARHAREEITEHRARVVNALLGTMKE
jgi:hypothetical protein